jgi:hypothetical protein
MQNRIEARALGPYLTLRAEVLQFLRKWPDKSLAIAEEDISELTWLAVDPSRLLRGDNSPRVFAAKFCLWPDFVPALLMFVRRRWLKDSKQSRLQAYLATRGSHFWNNRKLDHKYDKEIASEFSRHTREAASESDVKTARRALAKKLAAGMRAKWPKEKISRKASL